MAAEVLPNLRVYPNTLLEFDEVKKQVWELLEYGVVVLTSSSCESLVLLLIRKNDGRLIGVCVLIIVHLTFDCSN